MNSGRAVCPGRRPIYRQISIARPAERDARGDGGGGRSGEVNDDTLDERDKRRKEEKKASEEGSNNNDRRKKKTNNNKNKKEKEELGHADWIVGCFLFFGQLSLRFSTHDSNIYSNIYSQQLL